MWRRHYVVVITTWQIHQGSCDPFWDEHVPPPMVEYQRFVQHCRARMYELVPLRFEYSLTMLRKGGYAMLQWFDPMLVSRTFYTKSGNKTK